MKTASWCAVCVVLAAVCGQVRGQGFLVVQEPPSPILPTQQYEVASLRVDAQIDRQVARVQVEQVFRNTGAGIIEVEFLFPLPPGGAVDQLVLTVEGKEFSGRLLSREEARRIYEDIIRRRQDPALVEFMGRGLFKTSVFPVPPGQERRVTVGYTQVLDRDSNLISFAYPLGASAERHAVRELVINGRIQHDQPIKSVYSPTHALDVARPSDNAATFCLKQQQVIPRGTLQLVYSLAGEDVGLSVLSYRPDPKDAGYFLMLASPKVEIPDREILSKSVVFVLDKSGSMTGHKIEQAKNSLRFVLRHLNPDDTFNIITYDGTVTAYQPELQRCDDRSIAAALEFVERISAGGSTHIDGALRSALDMLKVEERPSYVVFLTDGLPTAGEQRPAAIAENACKANRVRARLMAFGVGDDVDAQLLDRLVAENFGASHYVRPDEDIEAPVSKLFAKLSAPVLSGVSLEFAGLDSARTYPQVLPDVFRGGQLIVVGRYHHSGQASVTLRGRAGGEVRTFSQHVQLDDNQAPFSTAFVEKLWAERRVGYLIDEIDLRGPNQELVQEIVQLSTRHGILTPYTSFLADDGVELANIRANAASCTDRLEMLSHSSGSAGVAQRRAKGLYKSAEHAPSAGVGMADDFDGRQREVETVFTLGSRTFFKKDRRWRDSTVTPHLEAAAVRVVRFSDAYFDLACKLPADASRYLTLDGEILMAVQGQAYLIVSE